MHPTNIEFQIVDIQAADIPSGNTVYYLNKADTKIDWKQPAMEWSKIDLGGNVTINNEEHFPTPIRDEFVDFVARDTQPSHCSLRYTIYLFGVTMTGENVSVKIMDYYPTLLVRIQGDETKIDNFITGAPKYMRNYMITEKGQNVYRKIATHHDTTLYKFRQIRFATLYAMKQFQKRLLGKAYSQKYDNPSNFYTEKDIFENHIPPYIRMLNHQNIDPFGWVSIPDAYRTCRDPMSNCDIHLCNVPFKKISRIERLEFAPLKIISFDLECISSDNNFPSAERQGDMIINIGAVVSIANQGVTNYRRKWIACLDSCDPIENADVVVCATEFEVIQAFVYFLRDEKPHVLTGYNINNFDFNYIHNRLALMKKPNLFDMCSRLNNTRVQWREKVTESAALGQVTQTYYDIHGMVVIDMLEFVKRTQKLRSYRLDAVAELFIQSNKDDLEPNQIFAYFRKDSYHRSIVAKYCIQDCFLVNQLLEKLMVLTSEGGIANVCHVPMSFIFYRGQTIKSLVLFDKFARANGFVLQDTSDKNGQKYEGALVWEAKLGMYNDPINVNDFNSLYPSSSISHNISPDTYIPLDQLSNYDMSRVEIIKINDHTNHHYIKPDPDAVDEQQRKGRGILPLMEMFLLSQRAKYKKMMAKETDQFKKNILNGIQNAYKLTANSAYGALGAIDCKIYHPMSAESITAVGRSLIQLASRIVEREFPGTTVVYGDTDSLFVRFPSRDGCVTFEDRLKHSIACGEHIETMVSRELAYPHKFAYEKTYYPFMLFAKKRYVGAKYENDVNHFKQDAKGVILSRRDNALIVSMMYNGILDYILDQRQQVVGRDEIINYVKQQLQNIVNNKYPLEYFIITKNLGANYANPDTIAHDVLTRRMKARQKGSEGHVNDRIEYCHVKFSDKQLAENVKYRTSTPDKVRAGDMIDSPAYIKKHNLPLDYKYYFDKQLKTPINQLLALVVYNKPIDDNPQIEKELDRIIWNRVSTIDPNAGICKFFKPVVNRT